MSRTFDLRPFRRLLTAATEDDAGSPVDMDPKALHGGAVTDQMLVEATGADESRVQLFMREMETVGIVMREEDDSVDCHTAYKYELTDRGRWFRDHFLRHFRSDEFYDAWLAVTGGGGCDPEYDMREEREDGYHIRKSFVHTYKTETDNWPRTKAAIEQMTAALAIRPTVYDEERDYDVPTMGREFDDNSQYTTTPNGDWLMDTVGVRWLLWDVPLGGDDE